MKRTEIYTRPMIGQRVFITGEAIKERKLNALQNATRTIIANTIWECKRDVPPYLSYPSFFGFFTGYRTVYNGTTKIDLIDGRYREACFTPTEHFEVWLIVRNARQNPIRVFPSDALIIPHACPNCGWSSQLLVHPGGEDYRPFCFCPNCYIDTANRDDTLGSLTKIEGKWIDQYNGHEVKFLEIPKE